MSETTTATSAARAALGGVPHEPGAAKPDPILVVDNIVRQFGGMTAVDVGHLEVQRGVITALIGPNGAGKTTFFNLITGFDKPTSAKRLIGGVPADKAARWTFDGRLYGNAIEGTLTTPGGEKRPWQATRTALGEPAHINAPVILPPQIPQ